MNQVTENTNKQEALLKREQAKNEMWRRGYLRWKCHTGQEEMYDIFYNAPRRATMVWLISRQFGKTWLLGVLALEQALKKPNSIVKFVTDTKLHAETILIPKFEEILQDCPPDVKPEYRVKQYTFFFPNGSQIQLAGTDSKHYKRLRGQVCDLNLIDEAGFCNDLEEVFGGTLFPTTTHTGGKFVMASTMPEQQDHPFLIFKERAQFNGLLTEKTIDDNPLLTKQDVEDIAAGMGGRDSLRFKREYLNQVVKDDRISVIPEFDQKLEKDVVKEWQKPPFWDGYVSVDWGGKDLTVVLYAYFDFVNNKLIIEDEIKMDFRVAGNHLEKLTTQMLIKERDLYYNDAINEQKKPYMRVSDHEPLVTQEVTKYSYGQIYFTNAEKSDKHAAINDMRQRLEARQVIVNPRCKTLILHLNNVRWKSANNKDEFARDPEHGHYDAVHSLIYLIRSVRWNKNPYPPHYNIQQKDLFVTNPRKFEEQANDPYEVYKTIFGKKKRYK